MAHQITKTDAMITVRQQAWHKLGRVIPEHCTPAEALKLAGMEWTVEEATLSGVTETTEKDGADIDRRVVEHHEITTHKALIRSDTREVLGVVGSGYHVFQNADLAALVDDVVAGSLSAVETAGTLKGGRRVWFLLGGEEYDVAGVDPVKGYGLFCNGHDGGMAIRVLPTSVRVVCANTFTASGAEDLMRGLSIRHTSGAQDRIDEARAVLTKNAVELSAFHDVADALAAVEVDPKWLQQFFMRAYIDGGMTPPTQLVATMTEAEAKSAERANANAAATIQAWHANFEDADGGQAHKKVRTSAWAAFNSVTRWADHGRIVRGEQADPTARTYNNLLGSAATFKGHAMRAARDLALVN